MNRKIAPIAIASVCIVRVSLALVNSVVRKTNGRDKSIQEPQCILGNCMNTSGALLIIICPPIPHSKWHDNILTLHAAGIVLLLQETMIRAKARIIYSFIDEFGNKGK
jgi:hypothetical protein